MKTRKNVGVFLGRKRGTVSSRPKRCHDWHTSLAGGFRCACEVWLCESAEGSDQCDSAAEQGRKYCLTHPVILHSKDKERHGSSGPYSRVVSYAAFFFPAFTFAHLARCVAAIFLLLRAAADTVPPWVLLFGPVLEQPIQLCQPRPLVVFSVPA